MITKLLLANQGAVWKFAEELFSEVNSCFKNGFG